MDGFGTDERAVQLKCCSIKLAQPKTSAINVYGVVERDQVYDTNSR